MSQETTHDRRQSECFLWAYNSFPHVRKLLFAVPNEQKLLADKSPKQKAFILSILKSIGLTPGVFDLLFWWRGKLYGFDIKLPGDRPSDAQVSFAKLVVENGGKCYYVETLCEFQDIFKQILQDNP